jgi:hypothetical protein
LLQILEMPFSNRKDTCTRWAPGSRHVEDLSDIIERKAEALRFANEPEFLERLRPIRPVAAGAALNGRQQPQSLVVADCLRLDTGSTRELSD